MVLRLSGPVKSSEEVLRAILNTVSEAGFCRCRIYVADYRDKLQLVGVDSTGDAAIASKFQGLRILGKDTGEELDILRAISRVVISIGFEPQLVKDAMEMMLR